MINSTSPYDNTLINSNQDNIKISSNDGLSSISNIDNDTETSVINEELKDEVKELMKKDFTHPKHDDPNIQYKLYKKREYYYNKIPTRPIIDENTQYETIKKYSDDICGSDFSLHPLV